MAVSRRTIILGWTAGGATTAIIQSTLIIILAITFIGLGLALVS